MQSPWIRSPRWDGFWILSGFWLPSLFLLLPLQSTKPLILGITLCFWIGHRVSSLYLALGVGEYRGVLSSRKGYFFVLPCSLLVLLMAFVLIPEPLIPIPRLSRFLALGLADYFFSLYHFSVQHYGVLSVYRGRLANSQKDARLLRWDWWLCILFSGFFSLVMDLLNGSGDLHLLQPTLQPFLAPQFGTIRTVLSICLVLFWALTLTIYLRKRQGPARILYVSMLAYMTLVSFYVGPILYFAIIQIQHWFVSFGLVTHMASNSRLASKQEPWYTPAWINAQRFGPLGVLILLSLLLTPVLEADYYILQNFETTALTVQHFLVYFKDSIWLFVFGGLAFFSSFLHYIYDRGVFRFSDPVTRKAALTLLKSPQN